MFGYKEVLCNLSGVEPNGGSSPSLVWLAFSNSALMCIILATPYFWDKLFTKLLICLKRTSIAV